MQGIGAAFLIANSVAILTDAFPANQRGLALGITNVVGISGQFIGLVLGGILAPIDWRLIFLVSVPFGIVRDDLVVPEPARDRPRRSARRSTGPATSPSRVGLVLVMIGITYGIRPYGGTADGLASTRSSTAASAAASALLVALRRRSSCASTHPMFRLPLFRIRAFTFGVLSSFLSAVARGGLMFMLIIWLQGIWLPEHGYSFAHDAALGRDLHAAADARAS